MKVLDKVLEEGCDCNCRKFRLSPPKLNIKIKHVYIKVVDTFTWDSVEVADIIISLPCFYQGPSCMP